MKTGLKKNKKILIEIDILDINDIRPALNKLANEFVNGTQIVETQVFSAIVRGQMDFEVYENFEEKQINGVWCRVYKSKI